MSVSNLGKIGLYYAFYYSIGCIVWLSSHKPTDHTEVESNVISE